MSEVSLSFPYIVTIGVGDASAPYIVTIGVGRCVRPLFVTIGLDPMVQVNQSSKTKKRCS